MTKKIGLNACYVWEAGMGMVDAKIIILIPPLSHQMVSIPVYSSIP